MEPQIRGMTSGQTQIVCDKVLRLTVDWLKMQDVVRARCRVGGAMADLGQQCYIGLARVAFSVRKGEWCFGRLTWRLDPSFESLGPPEAKLRVIRL